MSNEIVEIYTDGACRGNPGPGGWGVLLRYKGREKTLYGGELNTTNNRMELMAVIVGLRELTRPCRVTVYTDSQYVKNGMSVWIHNWKQRGWLTANKQPVKNADLWQQLEDIAQQHDIEWQWIKGHANHAFNEQADKLANQGVDSLNLI